MAIDPLKRPAWQASIGRLAALVVGSLVLGLALGRTPEVLATALLGYALWSLWNLYRLQRWLATRRREPPEFAAGAWRELATELARRQRDTRTRRRHLVSLLRVFREAAQALPDGVVVLDPARRIEWLNVAAGTMLKLDTRRDRGRRIDDFLPDNQSRAWIAAAPDEPLFDVPAVKDPAQRLSLRLIRYGVDRQLLVVRDITKLMRLEQVRRDFVANVSHELRTPLTVLHGYLDLLDPEDLPMWADVIEDLRGQSRRMAQIVEDLLTLSRLEAPQDVPDERVAMRPMLATLKREAEALSNGRHAVNLDAGCDRDLRGSTPYLHSAFSNLVSNAVRYTPAGGRITIGWQALADGGAQLYVRDTGYGIPEEHIPRITERFYRVSSSRSRATGGTGLGLSIAKHALNLHHARLEIESTVGVGSCFRCLFPPSQVLAAEPVEGADA